MGIKTGNRRCFYCRDWIEKDDARLVNYSRCRQRFCGDECFKQNYLERGYPKSAVEVDSLENE